MSARWLTHRADRSGPKRSTSSQAIALRGEVARRLESRFGTGRPPLVVEATVALFEAEAASIALYDAASDQLVFEVAAGEQGQGVIGVAIRPDQGIAGYVYTTGQALALSDVASDPRFGRTVAERTAYVPRSIVAVPLVDDQGTIGVLEVLDKRSQAAFSLRDIELAGVFARQAAVAIRASRVERDLGALLRATLRDQVAAIGPTARRPWTSSSGPARSAWIATTTAGSGRSSSRSPGSAASDPDQLELVTDLLGAVARQAERDARRRRGRSGSGRARPTGDRRVPAGLERAVRR